jgi:putative transposase
MLETVEKTRERAGWTISGILEALGLSRSVYYAWRRREDRLEDASPPGYLLERALPEEVEAVVEYALEHPREGYRRLTWMMVDDDVAFLSPPSVYRILSERDLLCRWKPRGETTGTRPEPPTRPNEQWHTDLMYLWVKGRWYFLVTVLDAYSRYIVHWELLLTMRADDVTDVIHAALEKCPGERPRMVHDRGAQFTGREFRQLTRRFNLEDIPTKIAHPQSNGLQERWFRTLRQEGLSEAELGSYERAVEVIGGWVDYYNRERLHASLKYLPPEEYFRGDPAKRISQRKKKLAQARWNRRERNRLVLEERNAREERSALSAGLQKKEEEVSLTKSGGLSKTL